MTFMRDRPDAKSGLEIILKKEQTHPKMPTPEAKLEGLAWRDFSSQE